MKHLYSRLLTLAGESGVTVSLLAEDADLIALIRADASYAECLAYVQDQY